MRNATSRRAEIPVPTETVERLVGTLATAASLLRAMAPASGLLNVEPSAARCARASKELLDIISQERDHAA